MFPAKHISRKTFFAAAAVLAAGVAPANAYLFEDKNPTFTESGDIEYCVQYKLFKIDNVTDETNISTFAAAVFDESITHPWRNDAQTPSYKTFIKTGEGTLDAYVGVSGTSLYNKHNLGYTNNSVNDDGAYYWYSADDDTGVPVGDTKTFNYGTASSAQNLVAWKGGELVVDGGTLNLSGYVNAWFDFGSVFNKEKLGTEEGQMVGVSLITVRSGATLDLSGNSNFGNSTSSHSMMVVDGSRTTFQFLRNLQAGDLGSSVGASLALGTASNFHVNIHVDDWESNTRIDTGVSSGEGGNYYADSSLAFGGSIGTISGAGSIYKTGEGAFTILGSNPGFTGSLYAAGGELVLAANNNVGGGEITIEPIAGTVLKARISSSVGNAESVNIAGTDAGQGSAIVRNESYAVVIVDTDSTDEIAEHYRAVKESYFTSPEAGTLVIATSQSIKNFQSYFAAGATASSTKDPHSGKTYKARVEDAISAAIADTDGVLAPVGSSTMTGTSDAPIIAGTGKGSKLVIAGANFEEEKGSDGTITGYTPITDSDGYVKGGVLLITQEAGKGGVYQGSIVGATVTLYNKTKFAKKTKEIETKSGTETTQPGELAITNEGRKKDALLSDDEIRAALGNIYGEDQKETKFKELKVSNGSFALDNETAIDLVNYLSSCHESLDTTSSSSTDYVDYYVEYAADSSVRGGTLVLDGAGDLALLLEDANYSGIYIASTRTGKTVLNITALNSFVGQELSLGNENGTVSFVVNVSETFRAKLTGFGTGSSLTFAVGEDVETLSGNVVVGNTRAAAVEMLYTQDDVYGTVYVERGLTLNLSNDADVFPNARAIVVHQGDTGVDLKGDAAPRISVSKNQLVNNLTADDTSEVQVKNGSVLTINVDSNDTDSSSGLALGTINGALDGNGSIVKGGARTLTLGGGSNTASLTGTLEIGQGALNVTEAESLSGASALILNSGTTATMVGSQSLRTIYGTGTLSVTGTLTLGANATAEAGSNRYYVATNLGSSDQTNYLATSTDDSVKANVSFNRFVGKYDKEGNYVLSELPTSSSQSADTKTYLEATAKLAYSGFDVSSLEAFVTSGVLEQTQYEAVKGAAETAKWTETNKTLKVTIGTSTQETSTVDVTAAGLLSSLGDLYIALEEKATYEDYFYSGKNENGKETYSAYGTGTENNNKLRSLYISVYGRSEGLKQYQAFTESGDVTDYKTLTATYNKLITDQHKKFFDSTFTTSMTLAQAKALFSEFYSIKNPGGTALYSEEEFLTDFGNLDFSKSGSKDTLTAENVKDLREKYAALYKSAEAIVAKNNFAGIEIIGAFANDVSTSGELVADWSGNIEFSGNITAENFVKTGDNTILLTGTLSTGSLVVNGGTLEIESSTLTTTLTGGVSIDRGATLSVNADEDVSATFSQNVLGSGNFVKTGDGTLILGENVRYSGTTTIEGGTLQLRLRNSITAENSDTGSVILPQGDITFSASNTSLILAQGDDTGSPVTWNSKISEGTSVSGVSVEKTGEAALTLTSSVSLGDSATLAVSAGTLSLTGTLTLGTGSNIKIASGAALELSSATISETSFAGAGALRVVSTAAVSIEGSSRDVVVGANGTGSAFDPVFTGAVTVGSAENTAATLTLSGESVFDFAREITVSKSSTLEIKNGTGSATTQTVRALSGSGTVSIDSGATLSVARVGDRLETDYSTKSYAFNEDVLVAAPNFEGTVSGSGTLDIAGTGLSRFSGTVSVSNISIKNGGQAVFNAENFTSKVVVNGTNTIKKDSDGNKIVAEAGKNYVYDASTNTLSDDGDTTQSVDNLKVRTVRTSDGALVDIVAAGITLKTEESSTTGEKRHYYVENGDRVYVDVVEWDYITKKTNEATAECSSLNWALVTEVENEKVYITGADLENLISWNSKDDKWEIPEGYSIGFYQLSETEEGTFVASTGTSAALASEVIFTVAAGKTAEIGAGTTGIGSVSFEGSGGKFGKVGDGTLNITNASTTLASCGGVTVYEGTLHLNEWVDVDQLIVEGATLEVELKTANSFNFQKVRGSGTFAVTAAANANVQISSDGTSGNTSSTSTNILPTWSADGKFFNGVYLFKNPTEGGLYSVTVSDTDLPGIGTESNVKLTLENVTIVQTQNSEIKGEVTIQRSLSIAGTESNGTSGDVLSENLRILTMSGTITNSNGITVKNVGFGFSVNQQTALSIKVDNASIANSFFIRSDSDGNGKAGDNVKIYATKDSLESAKLNKFSIIKTGAGTVTYDLEEVIESTKNLGTSQDAADYFGVQASIYDALNENSGVLNLGVSEAKLVIKNLEKTLSSDGTLSVYNAPVDLNFVTLRSTTGATAGTLVFGEKSTTKGSSPDASILFAESIRGGGNVEFNQKGLNVSAKQYYYGQTLVAADTTFSGAGRELASSFVQVASGATLFGGVVLAAREVGYSVSAARGMDDDGTAGKTALTIELNDPRLSSELKCTLNLSSDLETVSGLEELGVGVEGVTISDPVYDAEKKILTLTLTDSAYATENTDSIGGSTLLGDVYQVSIDLSRAIPSTANTTRTTTGTASVAADFTASAGSTISLDATAGDKVSVGAGTVQLDGATIVRNLGDSVRGKALTLFDASSISRTTATSTTTGTTAVIASLSEGNDALKAANETMMKLVVYTDAASGEIRAQMVTDNFAEIDADYSSAVSDSFLNALSYVATNGNVNRERLLINGDSLDNSKKALLLALNSVTTDQLGAEVTKLSPALFGSMLAMPVAAFNSDIARLHSRLDQRRYDGADPLRESGEYEFFMLVQGDFAENDDATDSPTFDYNLYGVTAGFDWKPNYQTTLGFALGYTYGKASAHDSGGKVDMDDIRATAFASHLFDSFYLECGAQVGYGSFDTRRETIAGSASGDTNSLFAGGFATTGMVHTIFYNKKTDEGLFFMPSLGLSFFHERIDGFKESGLAGLKLDDADGNSLRARIAAGIQWTFPVAETQMRLGAELAYSHDFLGEELDWDGCFTSAQGTNFSSSAKAMGTDVFTFSPTLDIMFSYKTSAFFGYGIDINFDSGISHGINAGFRHRF